MDTIDDIVDEEDEDDTEDEDRDEKDDPPLPASDDSLPSYGLFVCLFDCFYILNQSFKLYRPVHTNGTLNFANKIINIDHIDLILSGIHIHSMPHVSCKIGNDIQRYKATVMILVKKAKII